MLRASGETPGHADDSASSGRIVILSYAERYDLYLIKATSYMDYGDPA